MAARSILRPLTHSTRSATPYNLSSVPIRQSQACLYSTTAPQANKRSETPVVDPRWLSSLRKRIGQCITFGLNDAQTQQAGKILEELSTNWRDLIAGSEGYLTESGRRGLWRHEVAWGEMDSMVSFYINKGHVNNVMYNRYAESARVQWTQNFAKLDPAHAAEWRQLSTPKGIGMILRSIRTDFKFPMLWPDRVTTLHKLREEPGKGMDAFTLDVVILSERHQRPAARCVEDIVVYDYKAGRKAPMLPFMIDIMKETFQLQEQARQKNTTRVRELSQLVEQLEKGSWDRPDAKEDFGSAKP